MALLLLSHLSPCPSQLWREPGTPGGPLRRHHHSTVACAPWRGSAAAVAQLQALGFINNAAWRWGPTQPPVTLGHPVWQLQLAVLWQSPSPFQPAPLLLLCELGPEARPLWARPGAEECGRTQNPLSFCTLPLPQPSQVNWPLAPQVQAGEGWPALQGPPPFQPLHFADGVTESREGRMAKASQQMNTSFRPILLSLRALLSLSSAKSRAWGGRGMFGKVVAAERLPWRCCRMPS